MKAAVFHGAHDIRIEDVPYPKVDPDGVIIKVKACGICGSDLHPYRRGGQEGMILGHEVSGDIVEIGANVKGIEKGERVVAVCGKTCGQCYWCQQGQWIRCPNLVVLGYGIPGAFAQYVSISLFEMGLYAAKLPDTLTYEEGATVEPLSVALYAVKRAQPQPEDTVVVLGAGMIGLCVVQVLKALGVTNIIVSGRRAKRLELAKESGANVVVDAAQEDIVPIAKEATSGKGVDIVFECAGSPDTYQQSIEMVHRGGKIMLVAIYEQPITWNPSLIVGRDIDMIGSFGEDFTTTVNLLKDGKVNTKPLVSHEFPLDKIKEAFDTQLGAQDAVKVLVKP